MFGLALFSLLFFIIGVLGGKFLASLGVTINFNLENSLSQKWILIILSAIPLIVLFLILMDNLNLTHQVTMFIPEIILLYLGEYIYDFIIVIGCSILGLLISLELCTKSTHQTKIQLFIALLIISLGLSFLVHKTWPIVGELRNPKVIDNYIVLQTTDFTCVPASIATLGRVSGKYPQLSEKEVVLLTNTDRRGTSTLAEIKALKKLGLNPEYRRGLTVDHLSTINRPAILHVREKITTNTIIVHAVALLSVNNAKKVLKIANPLYGIQYKSYEQMKDYWYGEAVFIS
jgi:predicted double-glycine peptidase